MDFLTNTHLQLERSQQSELLLKFDKLPFDGKLLSIGLLLSAGIFCGANAFRGELSDRQSFCLKLPDQELRCSDRNNRPYRMTTWQWNEWGKEGRPRTIVPSSFTKSTNPYKPYWALGASVSFGIAGYKLRHLQNTERKLAPFRDIYERTQIAAAETEAQISLLPRYGDLRIAEVELQADLEIAANNRTVDLQKAEILGQTEIKVTELEASDALFEAETAGMSEEQKREYIDFIRKQKTPYLSGNQTLDSINNPGDKVEGESPQAIPFTNTDTVSEILGRVAREDGSTALCGDPGTGKSTITREYIRQVNLNYPDADVRVLAVKNDSFCGLREAGRVTRFIGDEAIANAKKFFVGVRDEYRRRLEVKNESERRALRPLIVILDDWLTISAKLNKLKPAELGFDFGEILFDILIIGREYNIKFFVNLHSLNLRAIGIKELDQNTRKILRLLLLGNRYSQDGREVDAYGVIEQAIMGNQVITHDEDKEKVRAEYSQLKTQSRQVFQPVMFAFLGGYYLGIVPKFGAEQILSFVPLSTNESDFEQLPEVSEIASKIIEILQAGNQPVSFESIRKSRRWRDNAPSAEEIRGGIQELIIKEFIDGDKDSGYSLIS